MKTNLLTFIVALELLIKCLAFSKIDFEIEMVSDVIQSFDNPKPVVACLSWTIQRKIALSVRLGKLRSNTASVHFAKKVAFAQNYNSKNNFIFLVDDSCICNNQIIDQANNMRGFSLRFRWIILKSFSIKSDPMSCTLENLEIFPDSQVTVITRGDNNSYNLDLVYKIGAGKDARTEHYGNWNPRNRFQKTISVDSTALRRMNLDGFVIPICYVVTDNDSVNHLMDVIDSHIDTMTKVNFPLTNHLLDFLNAGRKYIFVNSWGYRVNGTWNGMTGYLVREEVEIGGSPMFFTLERIDIVDYIASPTPSRSKFVFQQPRLSDENNLFLLSFRSSVWYSTIALIFLLFLALLAVAFWEWEKNAEEYYEIREQNPSILRAKVSDLLMLVFGAICQQGSTVELKGSLGRVVMLVLFLTLMFLYTSYSANIVALLQSSSSQIRTLEDLLHSRIQFGVHDTIFNRYYFQTATEPIRKAIYHKKVAPPGVKPHFMTMEEGVKKIQQGLFAFHMELGVGYKFVGKYFQEDEKCGLKEIQYLEVVDPWVAVRKNTPYKEMFKIGLKRIQEHGLQTRQNLLLYEKRPKCSGRGATFISVSMVDCYPVLLVLTYGMVAGLLFLGIEKLWHKRQGMRDTI